VLLISAGFSFLVCMNIKGKVAVITGAASGIGRALALAMAGPCRGLALCEINAEGLEETAQMARKQDCQVYTQLVDTAKREQMEEFAEAAIAEFEAVDVVINNAGMAIGRASVLDVPLEALELIVGVNMWGMIYGTKIFLPHLITRPEAAVVNVSSLFGIMAVPDQAGYITTKFAIRGFNETLRMEMRHTQTHVHVMSVHPGGIATNIAKAAPRVTDMEDKLYQADIANFDRFLRMPPEKAARKILRGIQRKKGRLLIGWDARLMDIVVRLFPSAYLRFVGKRAYQQKRKVRREMGLED
jgi:short-subunit dehydrogenase